MGIDIWDKLWDQEAFISLRNPAWLGVDLAKWKIDWHRRRNFHEKRHAASRRRQAAANHGKGQQGIIKSFSWHPRVNGWLLFDIALVLKNRTTEISPATIPSRHFPGKSVEFCGSALPSGNVAMKPQQSGICHMHEDPSEKGRKQIAKLTQLA